MDEGEGPERSWLKSSYDALAGDDHLVDLWLVAFSFWRPKGRRKEETWIAMDGYYSRTHASAFAWLFGNRGGWVGIVGWGDGLGSVLSILGRGPSMASDDP